MKIARYAKLAKRFMSPCVIAALVVGCASLAPAETTLPKLAPPPASEIKRLGLDKKFYEKYINAGLPVISSRKVSDAALREAKYLIGKMLGHRPEFIKSLNKRDVRIVVMAYNEYTTQIPVSRSMDPDYWDKRARGICGGNMVSCAEENLLNFKGDSYDGECIFIHEFGHKTIGFAKGIRKVYDTSIKKGLWKGTYAATNFDELWAEGVQSWFNCNRQNDSKHNHGNTRAELKKYDPELARLLTEVFGDKPWRYTKVTDREGKDLAHLGDYDPSKAPTFAWPQRVLDGWQRHLARVKRREAGKASTILIHLIGSSGGDKAIASLTAWRKRIEKKYVVRCTQSFGGDKAKSLDNLDRLKDIDILVVYGGGLEIGGDQLQMVKDYVASGRPTIWVHTRARTSSPVVE